MVEAGLMGGVEYRYELRRGDEIVATGHLSRERPLEVGERLTIGSREGIVRAVDPLLGEREQRLVVQLVREDG
jgi:hypothetical protein